MNASLSNFNKLSNSIRERAIQDIKQGLPDNQLIKWQELLTVILETELAMHRIRSALNLLKTVPSKETLSMFSMSGGTWIDYHYTGWSFWVYSFLEREKKLVKKIVRKLIKPSTPQYEDIEKDFVKSIEDHRKRVRKLRHPEAHAGEDGTIEKVMNEGLWKVSLITPSPVDYNHVLDSYIPSHLKWYNALHKYSILVLADLERICGELYQRIDWDNI